jgi:hypothetical protein
MHINQSATYHFNWEASFTKAERDWVQRNGPSLSATARFLFLQSLLTLHTNRRSL